MRSGEKKKEIEKDGGKGVDSEGHEIGDVEVKDGLTMAGGVESADTLLLSNKQPMTAPVTRPNSDSNNDHQLY